MLFMRLAQQYGKTLSGNAVMVKERGKSLFIKGVLLTEKCVLGKKKLFVVLGV